MSSRLLNALVGRPAVREVGLVHAAVEPGDHHHLCSAGALTSQPSGWSLYAL